MKISKLNIFYIIIIIIILYSILTNPNLVLTSASNGIEIWVQVIIPALLPFIIISELLISLGFVEILGKIFQPIISPLFKLDGRAVFPLIMGIMSGYPQGVKIVSQLRLENKLSLNDANKLVSFASTSSFLFMLGTVSIGILAEPSLGRFIVYPHFLSAFTLGIILRFKNAPVSKPPSKNFYRGEKENKKSIGEIFSQAVKNSMNTIIIIGGFIIFYSVLVELILNSTLFNKFLVLLTNISRNKPDENLIKGFVSGLLEITTGINKVASSQTSTINKLVIINFLIGWSGLSIHSQAMAFISKTDIKGKSYIVGKFFHGILSSIYTFILYKINILSIPSFTKAPDPSFYFYPYHWPHYYLGTIKLILYLFIYLLIISLILYIVFGFKRKN